MLTVLGNPENRRVVGFVEAARSREIETTVVSWESLLDGEPLPEAGVLRVDSPGENAAVRRGLLTLGSEADSLGPDRLEALAADPTRVGGSRRLHTGVQRLLDHVDVPCFPAPHAIAALGDKTACSARLTAAGVAVPQVLGPVAGMDDLLAVLRAEPRVFVKPRHGSSASGVLAWRTDGRRHRVTTSVEVAEGGLHNSLRVRTYTDLAVLRRIVDELADDGLHVERWVPKAGVGGRTFDLRIVVVGDRADHVVVRTARGPITNLHLGNARGRLEDVRATLGSGAIDAARETARAAVGVFSEAPWAGVDVLLTPRGEPVVCEVNAFGDLLPGIVDAEGRSTWAAEVDWLQANALG